MHWRSHICVFGSLQEASNIIQCVWWCRSKCWSRLFQKFGGSDHFQKGPTKTSFSMRLFLLLLFYLAHFISVLGKHLNMYSNTVLYFIKLIFNLTLENFNVYYPYLHEIFFPVITLYLVTITKKETSYNLMMNEWSRVNTK